MPPGLVAPPLRQVERKWKYCLPKFQPFRYEALKAVKPQTLDPKFEHGPVKLPECPVLTLRGEDCSAVRPAEGREEGFQEGFPDAKALYEVIKKSYGGTVRASRSVLCSSSRLPAPSDHYLKGQGT